MSTPCCPQFDPTPWDQKTIQWQDKPFITDRVTSFFHIPLNFPNVMKRIMAKMQNAQAESKEMIVLADENSLWGADVFVDVDKPISDAKMTYISGTFLTKVFEGPYYNMKSWIKQMEAYVQEQGNQLKKMYFYYTTCPKCAKKYGKNYVVILAQV